MWAGLGACGAAVAGYHPRAISNRPVFAPMTTPAPEIITVNKRRIACDGGGALGHPQVFLEMGTDTPSRVPLLRPQVRAVARGGRGRAPLSAAKARDDQARRSSLSDRRVGLYFSRLSCAAAADAQERRDAGGRGVGFLQHAVQAVARHEGGRAADAFGRHVRHRARRLFATRFIPSTRRTGRRRRKI